VDVLRLVRRYATVPNTVTNSNNQIRLATRISLTSVVSRPGFVVHLTIRRTFRLTISTIPHVRRRRTERNTHWSQSFRYQTEWRQSSWDLGLAMARMRQPSAGSTHFYCALKKGRTSTNILPVRNARHPVRRGAIHSLFTVGQPQRRVPRAVPRRFRPAGRD